MICEVRGVFPTVPNNARSARGRRRAASGGTGGRAHTRALTRAAERTHQVLADGKAGRHPRPHALPGIPTHTHIYVFLPRKKCK